MYEANSPQALRMGYDAYQHGAQHQHAALHLTEGLIETRRTAPFFDDVRIQSIIVSHPLPHDP